jgi:hypothetical protein
VTLRARWVTLRARWVTLRARWVTLRARWVTLRARWVASRRRTRVESGPRRRGGWRKRLRRAQRRQRRGALELEPSDFTALYRFFYRHRFFNPQQLGLGCTRCVELEHIAAEEAVGRGGSGGASQKASDAMHARLAAQAQQLEGLQARCAELQSAAAEVSLLGRRYKSFLSDAYPAG